MKMVQPVKDGMTKTDLGFLSLDNALRVAQFHKSFPVYSETPLVPLKILAR